MLEFTKKLTVGSAGATGLQVLKCGLWAAIRTCKKKGTDGTVHTCSLQVNTQQLIIITINIQHTDLKKKRKYNIFLQKSSRSS